MRDIQTSQNNDNGESLGKHLKEFKTKMSEQIGSQIMRKIPQNMSEFQEYTNKLKHNI